MFRIFGGLLILAGPLIYISQPHKWLFFVLILVLFTAGICMIFLRYGLSIDTKGKSYRMYTQLFWLQFGDNIPFNKIEKFFINEVSDTTVMTTRAGITHDIKNSVFKAYMKLDNREKVHVDTDSNYEKLRVRVESYQTKCEAFLLSSSLE